MLNRRELHLLMLQTLQSSRTSGQPPRLNLQLGAQELRDLEAAGDRALREAGWLAELPLDGVLPAFLFRPR